MFKDAKHENHCQLQMRMSFSYGRPRLRLFPELDQAKSGSIAQLGIELPKTKFLLAKDGSAYLIDFEGATSSRTAKENNLLACSLLLDGLTADRATRSKKLR